MYISFNFQLNEWNKSIVLKSACYVLNVGIKNVSLLKKITIQIINTQYLT